MKLVFAFCTILASLATAAAADAATLTVKIEGVSGKGGTLMVAAFDHAGFPPGSKPLASRKLAASPGEMTVTFDNVPAGETGVRVLQDLNDNGHMDYTFGVLPAEPYGFSNNPPINMGPPSWDELKFTVKPGANEIIIRMK